MLKIKYAVGISFTTFIVVFLQAPDVQESILKFIVAGVVPGTNTELPPTLMLSLAGIGMIALLAWTARQEFYADAKQAIRPTKTRTRKKPSRTITAKKAVKRVLKRRAA